MALALTWLTSRVACSAEIGFKKGEAYIDIYISSLGQPRRLLKDVDVDDVDVVAIVQFLR